MDKPELIRLTAENELMQFLGVKIVKAEPEPNGNHLRAVSKGIISVDAKPIFPGRTISIWQTDIAYER